MSFSKAFLHSNKSLLVFTTSLSHPSSPPLNTPLLCFLGLFSDVYSRRTTSHHMACILLPEVAGRCSCHYRRRSFTTSIDDADDVTTSAGRGEEFNRVKRNTVRAIHASLHSCNENCLDCCERWRFLGKRTVLQIAKGHNFPCHGVVCSQHPSPLKKPK